MDAFKDLGNKRVNRYYEARVPDDYQRPKATDDYGMVWILQSRLLFLGSDAFLQEKFIREKYEKKRWIPKVRSLSYRLPSPSPILTIASPL